MAESFNALRERTLRTPFVHVPSTDWAAVRIGEKREFRTTRNGPNLPWAHAKSSTIDLPFPVVAWAMTRPTRRGRDSGRFETLMMLEETWQEPLRAIGTESLEREGFEDYDAFRRYWIRRHPNAGWRGITQVLVFRMRPMEDGDLEEARAALMEHFFGLWLTPELQAVSLG